MKMNDPKIFLYISLAALVALVITLICYTISIYRSRKKLREECKEHTWIYLRRCTNCGKWQVLNEETNEYKDIEE